MANAPHEYKYILSIGDTFWNLTDKQESQLLWFTQWDLPDLPIH